MKKEREQLEERKTSHCRAALSHFLSPPVTFIHHICDHLCVHLTRSYGDDDENVIIMQPYHVTCSTSGCRAGGWQTFVVVSVTKGIVAQIINSFILLIAQVKAAEKRGWGESQVEPGTHTHAAFSAPHTCLHVMSMNQYSTNMFVECNSGFRINLTEW